MSFRDYLAKHKLSHLQGDQRKEAYALYKRLYVRAYMRQKRQTHQVVELFFTSQEYERLTHRALQQQGLSRSNFCKQTILKQLDFPLVHPNQELIADLHIGIRRIGNNINQLAKLSHFQQGVNPFSTEEEVFVQLKSLEELVQTTLQSPDLFESRK